MRSYRISNPALALSRSLALALALSPSAEKALKVHKELSLFTILFVYLGFNSCEFGKEEESKETREERDRERERMNAANGKDHQRRRLVDDAYHHHHHPEEERTTTVKSEEEEGEIVGFKIARMRRPKTRLLLSSNPLLFASTNDDFANNETTRERTDSGSGGVALQLREEFGAVALGETVRLLVSAQNKRKTLRMAAKVRVVVEVLVNVGRAQARGKRASFVLVDERQNAASADVVLKPMESHDVEVQFDAKQLGQHTIRCTAEYVDAPYDERSAMTIMSVAGENTVYDVGVSKKTMNFFSFDVTNPLHVRTKTRRVFSSSSSSSSSNSSGSSSSSSSSSSSKEKVFLEAMIENVDKTDARLITKVHLIVDEKRHVSTPMFPEISDEEVLFDVGNNKNQIYLQKDGGAAHFLFELEEKEECATTTTATSGKDELGTLEICWLGSTGEPGRLQTQPILAPKPSDTTPPQITRGASLGGGGEYGRPIIKTKVEILENEEGENVSNGANVNAAVTRVVPEKVTTVTAERPFLVRVKVSNLSPTTDSGAVEVRIEDDAIVTATTTTTSNVTNGAETQNVFSDNVNAVLSHSGTIRVNGESIKTLRDIPKNNGYREALFEMVALVPGVKKLPQITVRELNGRVLLSPAAREVFVLAP